MKPTIEAINELYNGYQDARATMLQARAKMLRDEQDLLVALLDNGDARAFKINWPHVRRILER